MAGVPRAVLRAAAREEAYLRRPPVLANSFPKSGTHLLLQMLQGLPGLKRWGAFWATQPSIPFRERSGRTMARKIRGAAPGELAAGHVFHAGEVAKALRSRNFLHFFLYRDPRDVVVSEAHYLGTMNRWHRMHPFFAALPTLEERISLSILGAGEHGLGAGSTGGAPGAFPYDYPNVAGRWERYRGWLGEPGVVPLRYEELVGRSLEGGSGAPAAGVEAAARRMAEAWSRHSAWEGDPASLVPALLAAVRPERSRTFRAGTVGGWRTHFTPRLVREMKSVAGDLLVTLGYEEGTDW